MPKKEDRALVANLLERNNGQRMTYLGVGCAEKRRGFASCATPTLARKKRNNTYWRTCVSCRRFA